MPEGVEELAEQVMRGHATVVPAPRCCWRTICAPTTGRRSGRTCRPGTAGRSWTDFLLAGKRGTSEQFAAAYVALARIVGIPARLAVGFRMPAGQPPGAPVIVRNRDVLAWPEVAVRGVGWVPLDPSRAAAGATAGSGLAAQAERARTQQPAPQDLRDAAGHAGRTPSRRPGGQQRRIRAWMALLAVPLLPLLGWPVGVPAAWRLRSWRRRRRRGTAAVLGAWAEVRDRLRAYGVPVTPGMTVRELSAAAGSVTGPETVEEIGRLAVTVDRALWSGAGPSREDDAAAAWESVRVVRRGLAGRGLPRRLRAVLDPRPLLPVSRGRLRRGSPSVR